MNIPIALDSSRLDAALASIRCDYDLLIDGNWRKTVDGCVLTRTSPAHGVTVPTYARAGAVEVEAALAAARRAFDDGPWPQLTGAERSKRLLNVASLIERDAELLATLDGL